MKVISICCLFSFFVLLGCDSNKGLITNEIFHVKASSNKPKGCDELGKVNGVSLSEGKIGKLALYKEALQDIKKSVSSLGGNYIHIQRVIKDGAMISGQAYQCDNFYVSEKKE